MSSCEATGMDCTTDADCCPGDYCDEATGMCGMVTGSCDEQLAENGIDVAPGETEVIDDSPDCTETNGIAKAEGEGYPDGVTMSDDPGTLRVAVTASVAPGTYPGNIKFTFLDETTQTIPFVVTVGLPAISITASPPSLVVSPGTTAQTTIGVTWEFGATGDVTVAPSGLPAGVTASSITVHFGTGSGVLQLSAASGATLTNSPVNATLTATDGSLNATATLPVSVQPPPPGALDASFGSAGIVRSNVGSGTFDVAYGAALAANDGIVVAGSTAASSNGSQSAFVARYNADGSPDTTFNTTGFATFAWTGNFSSIAYSVIVNPDQSIFVIGDGSADFGVAKFTSSGQLDSSFGNGGLAIGGINYGTAFTGYVDSMGRIVAAGYGNYSSGNQLTVARFNANGLGLDTTFNSPAGWHDVTFTALNSQFFGGRALSVVPLNGDIVAVGWAGDMGSSVNVAAVAFASDGSLDSGFGTGGIALQPATGYDFGLAAVAGSGGVYIAGEVGRNFLDMLVDSTGSLVTTFGAPNGYTSTAFGGTSFAVQANAIALQGDGKIITAGYSNDTNNKESVAVTRMTSTGTLDTTFEGPSGAGAGAVTFPVSTSGQDVANAVVIQSTGKIVLVGTTSTNGSSASSTIFLARLLK